MPFDGQESDNGGETEHHLLHVNPRRDENNLGKEVITLEVNDTLESGSQHKDSSMHNKEDEQDTVPTNVQENSHNTQTNSGSSDVPSDNQGVASKTLTGSDSNTQTNNSDLQSEDDFQNIKWNIPNPLRGQSNSSRVQDKPNIVLTQSMIDLILCFSLSINKYLFPKNTCTRRLKGLFSWAYKDV